MPEQHAEDELLDDCTNKLPLLDARRPERSSANDVLLLETAFRVEGLHHVAQRQHPSQMRVLVALCPKRLDRHTAVRAVHLEFEPYGLDTTMEED